MFNDRREAPSYDISAGAEPLVEARFVPQRYEPNYPYPLVVMFHQRGGDEQQMMRSMPAMSWRNYVGVSLRGPEAIQKQGRIIGHGWTEAFCKSGKARRSTLPQLTDADWLDRRLSDRSPDPVDALEDGVFSAIRRIRRSVHVHSERIFLMGCGEGAAVAYRLGLSYPEKFAGVVAINGWLPSGHGFRPLGRLKASRSLRILAVHGEWNGRVPVEKARRDVATLRAGGLKVAFQSYPCAHRMTSPMLSDVDTWLINRCTDPFEF
jgi:phospholipase/carboxylesterase